MNFKDKILIFKRNSMTTVIHLQSYFGFQNQEKKTEKHQSIVEFLSMEKGQNCITNTICFWPKENLSRQKN